MQVEKTNKMRLIQYRAILTRAIAAEAVVHVVQAIRKLQTAGTRIDNAQHSSTVDVVLCWYEHDKYEEEPR